MADAAFDAQVADTTGKLERCVTAINRLDSPSKRQQGAQRLLDTLRAWDNAVRTNLYNAEGTTTVIWVGTIPELVTITPAWIESNSVLNSPFARDLQRVATDGSYLAVNDVLPWIGVALLAVMAGVALWFGAPIIAAFVALSAAVVAVTAALALLVDNAGGVITQAPVTSGILAFSLLLIVAFFVYTRTRKAKS